MNRYQNIIKFTSKFNLIGELYIACSTKITGMKYLFSDFIQKSISTFFTSYELNYYYNSIYLSSFLNAFKEVKELDIKNAILTNENIFTKTWFENMDKEFEEKLISENFVNLLANYVANSFDLYNDMYEGFINHQLIYHNITDLYVKYFYSPFLSYSKDLNLSNHEIIFQKDTVKLLHYINKDSNRKTLVDENNNILLIIYAPINRFHILDLNSSKSVVKNLLNNDIDVYLLDWGYPDKRDDALTLKDYIDYIDDAVDAILQSRSFISSSLLLSTKISILGYCWGGITSLIYTAVAGAINQKNIDKLILMATPIDFSKDNTTISLWSKSIDTNKIIKTFGHFDGYFLDFIFTMRNPAKFLFAKYSNLVKKIDNKDFVNTFFDVEKWLHDTPPIPGELYKKIVNDCYKNNLLITGKMTLDEKVLEDKDDSNKINLTKITIPILSIIAEKDNLVSPMSSLAINDYISSKEKKVFMHHGGHVSLCISDHAHKELWPNVANWIKS
jgi:poly[(R)-3-hydroxyalkanoate] polymerase subunit PhaC